MTDYIQYRLPDDDNGEWVLEKIKEMGLDAFTEQEEKVALALDKLKPGKYYDMADLKEDKRENFIRLACLYIRNHPQVVFSNDYSRIEKIKL
jgi:hypothetical protein